MTIPPGAWPLLMFFLALFLLNMVALGIKLQREPLVLVDVVAIVLIVLLIGAMQNHGVSQLERVNVCQTPSNLAGCAGRGYSSQPIDAAHDIPIAGVPMTVRPTPQWAKSPGGPP